MNAYDWIVSLWPYGVICALALFFYLTLLSVEHARQAAIAQAIREYERQMMPPAPIPMPSPPHAQADAPPQPKPA